MGLFGKNAPAFGDKLTNVSQGLGAAQAFWDGDFGTGVGIQQMQQKRREEAQKAAMEPQNMAARYQRAIAAGMTPAQAAVVASGDAKFSDIFAKPTAEQQNFKAWQGYDPATRQQYGQYQDIVNPRFTNTPAGTQFIPRASIGGGGGLPPGYDPSEWEVVDAPGQASAPAAPDMPPDAQTMERLYVQQFGEARGRPMYQEWLRNVTRGR